MTRHTQGPPPPGTNDDARWQAGTEEEHGSGNAAIVSDLDASRKGFLTLQARAALAGIGLHELASGAFFVARWNLAREVPNLSAAADLLKRMGVRP